MYDFIIFKNDDDGNNIAGQCENVCHSGNSVTFKNVVVKGARFRKLNAEKSENRFYAEITLTNVPFAIFKRVEPQAIEVKEAS